MVTSFFPLYVFALCALSLLVGCDPPMRAQCINDSLAKPDRWLLCRALCAPGDDPESCAAMARVEAQTLKALATPVPDTRAGLRETLERLGTLTEQGKTGEASILANHLLLPDPPAWFGAHFPPGIAARLAQGYSPAAAQALRLAPGPQG